MNEHEKQNEASSARLLSGVPGLPANCGGAVQYANIVEISPCKRWQKYDMTASIFDSERQAGRLLAVTSPLHGAYKPITH